MKKVLLTLCGAVLLTALLAAPALAAHNLVMATCVPAPTPANASFGCSVNGGVVGFCIGTPGRDDTIRGTPGPDTIYGLDGNDTIYGFDGDDLICGGAGNDILNGGDGGDHLFGGNGRDRLYGERGDDHLVSGPDTDIDIVNGGPDSDTCFINAGDRVKNCP